MRIVFFGSSEFAIPSLASLKEAGMAPLLVVTKPDAARGRGKKIYDADVKVGAQELGLPVAQPADPHDPAFLKELKSLKPDVGIVVSYGVILQQTLIGLPKRAMINAHASLLPLYRGASPIQRAILEGRKETGVSIMRIVEKLDAGDVMLVEKTAIDPRENAGMLRDRLAVLAGKALVAALGQLAKKKEVWTPQEHAKATYAGKVEKLHGVIDWRLPAEQIARLVRAMTPWPGAQTRLGARRYIVMEGEVEQDNYGLGVPGKVQSGGEEGIRVCTGKELYRITRIKPENGRNMTAGEFVRGHPLAPDARLG